MNIEPDCRRLALFYSCRRSPGWHVCRNVSGRTSDWVNEARVAAALDATRFLQKAMDLVKLYDLKPGQENITLSGKT